MDLKIPEKFFDIEFSPDDITDLSDSRKEEVSKLLSLNPAPNHYSKFLFNFINAKIFLEINN